MRPLAPGLLSITIGCPSTLVMVGDMARTMMSGVAPAARLETTLMGRFGKSWATAVVAPNSAAIATRVAENLAIQSVSYSG